MTTAELTQAYEELRAIVERICATLDIDPDAADVQFERQQGAEPDDVIEAETPQQ